MGQKREKRSRRPLIPRGHAILPKKGKGSYRRRKYEVSREIEEEVEEFKYSVLDEEDGWPD